MDKSRHYNIYKVAATVLVVLAHASNMYTANGAITPAVPSSFLASLTKLIYSFHMPFFMAVSGMVYGYCIDDLSKYDDYPRFLKGKALRLIVPYLFIGFCIVAPTMVLLGLTEEPFFRYCVSGILLMKNTRHLWFIAVLFEIFVIFGAGKRLIKRLNPLIILAGLAVVCIILSQLNGWLLTYQLKTYIFYFYAGYLFNRYFEKLYIIFRRPLTLAVSLVGLALLFRRPEAYIAPVTALLGGIIMIGVCSYAPGKLTDSRLFIRLNKTGFGIYLFHPMIIYWLYHFLGRLNMPPVVLCLGIAAVSYILSALITGLIQKSRKLSPLIGG